MGKGGNCEGGEILGIGVFAKKGFEGKLLMNLG